jgi:Asp-tRNA(Asn)/Glu-tRNA(Gln) amidotransferase A subunit family amidase
MARAESVNPEINAIVRPMYDEARAAVEAGLPDGPFTGVPMVLKDTGPFYQGVVTSFGSKLFADFVPGHDSEVVARYKRAGMVIMGKTNTSEMGLVAITEPRLFGATRNPWNPAHTPGGSSGGAAAAVAAGILPAAHATDGGGSIRIPAACCGLFGLKPTRGRTPLGPEAGDRNGGFFTQHVVSRSVRDSAALLDATAGPDIGDPYWAPPPPGPFLAEVGKPPGRLRVAKQVTADDGSPVDAQCVEAVEAAAALCAELGHIVEEATPSYDVEALTEASLIIWSANVAAGISGRCKALGRDPRPDDVEAYTWYMAEMGWRCTGAEYVWAIATTHAAGRALGRYFSTYDLMLTPTTATPPVKIGVFDTATEDGESLRLRHGRFVPLTALQNATGQPAMSVPLHWTGDGLPVGVHFVGRFGDEATLLRLAAQIEEARPWSDRRPS